VKQIVILLILSILTLPAFAQPPSVHAEGLAINQCFENARKLLKVMSEQGVDIADSKNIEVLYITNFYNPEPFRGVQAQYKLTGQIDFHVVIRVGEYIYDGNTYDASGKVDAIPMKNYFRFEPYNGKGISKLRRIVGEDYVQENRHPHYYLKGLRMLLNNQLQQQIERVDSEAEHRYPSQDLCEFLGRCEK
jgi:hypothetical protein